jgi:hypothetical protein
MNFYAGESHLIGRGEQEHAKKMQPVSEWYKTFCRSLQPSAQGTKTNPCHCHGGRQEKNSFLSATLEDLEVHLFNHGITSPSIREGKFQNEKSSSMKWTMKE